MSFLLDTNVISEPMKPHPDPGVVDWLAAADEDSLYISVITIIEIRYGIERLHKGKRRSQLDLWLEEQLVPRFGNRVLPIDATTANLCGRLMAQSESRGRRIEVRDALIAASALVHELTLVTRNVSDFKEILQSITAPWSESV